MLQSAYSDYQFGPFKNFHQFVEDALVVLRSGLKVLLQYALCFADRLKRQLLISHSLSPITQNKTELQTKKRATTLTREGKSSFFLIYPHQILFLCGQRCCQRVRQGKKVSNFRPLFFVMDRRKAYSKSAIASGRNAIAL